MNIILYKIIFLFLISFYVFGCSWVCASGVKIAYTAPVECNEYNDNLCKTTYGEGWEALDVTDLMTINLEWISDNDYFLSNTGWPVYPWIKYDLHNAQNLVICGVQTKSKPDNNYFRRVLFATQNCNTHPAPGMCIKYY